MKNMVNLKEKQQSIQEIITEKDTNQDNRPSPWNKPVSVPTQPLSLLLLMFLKANFIIM